MEAHPSRSYSKLAAAIIIAGVLVSGTLYLTVGQPGKTITSISSSISTITTTETLSPTTTETVTTIFTVSSTTTSTQTVTGNLTSSTATSTSYPPPSPELIVKLNATTISQGHAVLATIAIFNPLSSNLSVAPNYSSNSTIARWNEYDFICDDSPLWSLAGYALFQGHYSSENISSATNPLELTPSVALPCAFTPALDLAILLPNSSSAVGYFAPLNVSPSSANLTTNASTGYCISSSNGGECLAGNGLFGYWNATGTMPLENATITSEYFHYFSPGEYTLVTEDIWGQVIFSYFQVLV